MLKELPKGCQEVGYSVPRKAYGNGKFYYFCTECNIWYEGEPRVTREDTTGPLCGRRGVSENCESGHELNFMGYYC